MHSIKGCKVALILKWRCTFLKTHDHGTWIIPYVHFYRHKKHNCIGNISFALYLVTDISFIHLRAQAYFPPIFFARRPKAKTWSSSPR